jgi:serine/threonine protein kinase
LGIVLYVLLSGALPFASFEREEMDRQVIEDEVPFDESCFQSMDPLLKDLILKCLTKDPKKRMPID